MEIWLDYRQHPDGEREVPDGVNRFISNSRLDSEKNIYLFDDKLYIGEHIVGSAITVRDQTSQQRARSLIGSVEWLFLEFENWSMIPIENLIAACEGTPTRIAAVISKPEQANGAGFALERGVDALVVRSEKKMLDAARIVKSQRMEVTIIEQSVHIPNQQKTGISVLKVTSVENGGIAERYCVDTTRLLRLGEGMLVGSSASSFVLVHGETVESEYVPARPFRVNAGPPHAYVCMVDGTTKYLSELKTGDSILLTDTQGVQRHATIGRLKIEQRPMILIRWIDKNNKEGSVYLQQAETVRVIKEDKCLISVTELKKGDEILGWCQNGSRHIGTEISSTVVEK